MPHDKVENLKKRADAAWSTKSNWDEILREAYQYALPQRNLYDRPVPGQKKGSELFSSTAIVSTMKFSNKLVNILFPAFREWVKLQAGPAVDEAARDQVNEELEKITKVAFAVIHYASNFQTAIGEVGLDLAAGTGVMLTQKGTPDMPVQFEAIPQIQCAFEEGPSGTVDAIFRRFSVKARLIPLYWRDARLTGKIVEEINEEPEKEISLTECSYYDHDASVWRYDVIRPQTSARLVKRQRKTGPFQVVRYTKVAGEVNGRGPLLQAMPDIKTLNKLIELVLRNATLAIAGPYTVTDDGTVNVDTLEIAPNAFIPVARNEGHPMGPSISPLPRSGSFDIAQIEMERLITSVRTALLDEDLPDYSGQPRTAAEILQRVRQLVQELGATFGRIARELITPLFQAVLDILEDWGMIKMPGRINGHGVQLVVTSPLANQQNLDDVEAVVRWVEMVTAMFGKEILMMVAKVEDIPVWLAQKLGVPMELLRDETERSDLQDKIATILGGIEAQQPGAGLALLASAGQPGTVAPKPVG